MDTHHSDKLAEMEAWEAFIVNSFESSSLMRVDPLLISPKTKKRCAVVTFPGRRQLKPEEDQAYPRVLVQVFFALFLVGSVAVAALMFAVGFSYYQQDPNDAVRIQVSYNSERGSNIAQTCAESVIENREDSSELVMMASKKCLDDLQLEEDPDISHIEEDYPTQALSVDKESSNPLRRSLEIVPWGIKMIQADQIEMGAHSLKVCLPDTGISLNHPDFSHELITGNHTNHASGEVWEWNQDRSGHGTHGAGILSAMESNGFGVSGAGQIHLHVVRALDDRARGYESDMRNAISDCAKEGADIISLSLGAARISQMTSDLIDYVVDEMGVMVIAASGNAGVDTVLYPAAHPKVIAVGAAREDGSRWSNSNYGGQIELTAPGVKILSTSISSSSVRTEGFAHHAQYVDGSSHEAVTGTLKDCGDGSSRCPRNKNGICLLHVHNEDDLESMLSNCARSRARGAIVFGGTNCFESQEIVRDSDLLSVVWVKPSAGQELLQRHTMETVTIGDVDQDGIEYTYKEMSGTSMAVPHVAASAALVWSHFGESCSNHQIRYALTHSAYHPNLAADHGACDEEFGHGIVKAKDAYDFLVEHDCSTWTVPEASRQGGCTAAQHSVLHVTSNIFEHDHK